ncbi:MAG: PIN domain-containing protein [Terracidiphilus sp.]
MSDKVGTGTEPRLQLERFFRSNLLPQLVAFLRGIPAVAPLIHDIIQIRIVIDANKVQSELRWRLRRRKKPSAHTSLHEALVSGVLVAYAPEFLESEIKEHEEEIAAETASSVADVRREWQEFRALLHFYSPSLQSVNLIDPVDKDDLPYVAASKELGLPIYSEDRHHPQMGAPVICISIDTHLRDYARNSSIRVGVAVGSFFFAEISFDAIVAAYRLVRHGVKRFRRLHPALQIAIVGAAVVAVAHPKSRAKLLSTWQSIKCLAASTLIPATADLLVQYDEAMRIVDANYHEIQCTRPPERKRSLLMHARTVCMTAKRPLSLIEIERRVRAEGYSSRSGVFRSYLRRVLRSNGQFVEVTPGSWIFNTLPG